MILRFVVTTKCCSLSLHISLCGGTCAAVRQSAVHRPGPATMALFRSDILNQELFRRAVQAAERTASVEILELTIGEARTGLQVSEATCRVPRVLSHVSQEVAPVHITAEVRGRRREFCWTAKISPSASAAAALGDELRLWERELFVYKELLPALELKRKWLHGRGS